MLIIAMITYCCANSITKRVRCLIGCEVRSFVPKVQRNEQVRFHQERCSEKIVQYITQSWNTEYVDERSWVK